MFFLWFLNYTTKHISSAIPVLVLIHPLVFTPRVYMYILWIAT
ncbi:hypothetical protein DKAM_0680 [Desulfurococcus amylolyticus 1221n]|uniref:Uncharacterized protein n=1 Tax=Desulfurococcus amylolyticus (strain DSM 18924 / JCM 16383 / VKM B-2413 / 1221n) TaxID=490899 RepID=B8D4H5_DESA1|nr:hypothetical protein DKAM_0680 [Desulfurococcus amylolyticus 1221n]